MDEAAEVKNVHPMFAPGTGKVIKQLKLSPQISAIVIKEPKSLGQASYIYVMAILSGKKVLGFVTAEHSSVADMLMASVGMADSKDEGPMLCSYAKGVTGSHGTSVEYKDVDGFVRAALEVWREIVPESIQDSASSGESETRTAQESDSSNNWFKVAIVICIAAGIAAYAISNRYQYSESVPFMRIDKWSNERQYYDNDKKRWE